MALLRPYEVMKMGSYLSGVRSTCRANPNQRPTVGTGPASECGETIEGTTPYPRIKYGAG